MITVTFKDFDDMVAFGLRLAGSPEPTATESEAQRAPASATRQTPVAPTVSVAPPAQQEPALATQQTQAAPTVQTVQTVQTSAPSYSTDDLARAAMTLMDSGRQGDLISLLTQFGTDALTQLPQEQYGAFATALRGLGAPI